MWPASLGKQWRSLSVLFAVSFMQSDAGTAAVLVDELDAAEARGPRVEDNTKS
jgi:hypothetical protein